MIDEQPVGFWKKVRKIVRPGGIWIQKFDHYGLLFYERRYNHNQADKANQKYASLKKELANAMS